MIKALLFNAAGIVIYLLIASTTWNQEKTPLLFRTSDDALRWAQWCLPVLGFFALVNVAWLIGIVMRRRQSPVLASLCAWCAVIASWAGAYNYSLHRLTYESHPLSEEVLKELK